MAALSMAILRSQRRKMVPVLLAFDLGWGGENGIPGREVQLSGSTLMDFNSHLQRGSNL